MPVKGGRQDDELPSGELIIQEGVPTYERMNDAVAEPVVYMIDRYVVGGFYRLHGEKGSRESLNTRDGAGKIRQRQIVRGKHGASGEAARARRREGWPGSARGRSQQRGVLC